MASDKDGHARPNGVGSPLPFFLCLVLFVYILVDKLGFASCLGLSNPLGVRELVEACPCTTRLLPFSRPVVLQDQPPAPLPPVFLDTVTPSAPNGASDGINLAAARSRRMSPEEGTVPQHVALLFLFNALIFGTLITQLITSVPWLHGLQQTVVIFIVGVIYSLFFEGLGWNASLGVLGQSYIMWMDIDPHLLLFAMLPPLLAGDAMTMDTAIARKVFKQWLWLAGPGVLINALLTAVFLYFYLGDWDFLLCMVTGAVLCATDPVAVVALLKELGAPPALSVQIQGESLLNDGTAIVLYQLSFRMLQGEEFDISEIIVFLVKMVACAWGLGLLLGWFFNAWITAASSRLEHSSSVLQTALTLCCAYWSFLIAETIHISGVLSTVAASLVLADKMWPVLVSKECMHMVWAMFEFLMNILVFFVAGALSGNLMVHRPFADYLHVIVIYVVIVLIRLMLVLASRPIMNYFGKKEHPPIYVSLGDCLVMTWGGLRGAVGLALAIQVTKTTGEGTNISVEEGERVLFYVGGVAALTLAINASTCPALVKYLGVAALPETKKRVLVMVQEQLFWLLDSKCTEESRNSPAILGINYTLDHISQWIHGQGTMQDSRDGTDSEDIRASRTSDDSTKSQSKMQRLSKLVGNMLSPVRASFVGHHGAGHNHDRHHSLANVTPVTPVVAEEAPGRHLSKGSHKSNSSDRLTELSGKSRESTDRHLSKASSSSEGSGPSAEANNKPRYWSLARLSVLGTSVKKAFRKQDSNLSVATTKSRGAVTMKEMKQRFKSQVPERQNSSDAPQRQGSIPTSGGLTSGGPYGSSSSQASPAPPESSGESPHLIRTGSAFSRNSQCSTISKRSTLSSGVASLSLSSMVKTVTEKIFSDYDRHDLIAHDHLKAMLRDAKNRYVNASRESKNVWLLGDLRQLSEVDLELEKDSMAVIVEEEYEDISLAKALTKVFYNLVNSHYWMLIDSGEVVPGTREADILLSSVKFALGTSLTGLTDFTHICIAISSEISKIKAANEPRLSTRSSFSRSSESSVQSEVVDARKRIIDTTVFNAFVMVAIVSNAVFIYLENTLQSGTNSSDSAWLIGDVAFTVVFTVEFLMKFSSLRCAYFRDMWNVFDFVLVLLSLASNILGFIAQDTSVKDNDVGAEARLVRLARVFRIMRLMRLFRLLQFLHILKAKVIGLEFNSDVAHHIQTITVLTSFIKAHMHSQREILLYFGTNGKVDISELARCIVESRIQTYKALALAFTSVSQLDKAFLKDVHDQKRSARLAEQLDHLVHQAHAFGVITTREAEAVLSPVRAHLKELQKRIHQTHFGYVSTRKSDLSSDDGDDEEIDTYAITITRTMSTDFSSMQNQGEREEPRHSLDLLDEDDDEDDDDNADKPKDAWATLATEPTNLSRDSNCSAQSRGGGGVAFGSVSSDYGSQSAGILSDSSFCVLDASNKNESFAHNTLHAVNVFEGRSSSSSETYVGPAQDAHIIGKMDVENRAENISSPLPLDSHLPGTLHGDGNSSSTGC